MNAADRRQAPFMGRRLLARALMPGGLGPQRPVLRVALLPPAMGKTKNPGGGSAIQSQAEAKRSPKVGG